MSHPGLSFLSFSFLVEKKKKKGTGFNHKLREKTVASLQLIKISAL